MKNITSTLSGLSSSLFLNVGLTKIAEKLDPVVSNRSQLVEMRDAMACVACTPCNFGVRRQR
jgi:hypothetical protein